MTDYSVRLFGSVRCSHCCDLLLKIADDDTLPPVEIIDVDEDETQKLCDYYDVEDIPHVQILKSGIVIWQGFGSGMTIERISSTFRTFLDE